MLYFDYGLLGLEVCLCMNIFKSILTYIIRKIKKKQMGVQV